MTVLEELTREFGDAAIASAVIESLRDNGLEIRAGSIAPRRRGYSGARLVKAQLANLNGLPKPRWCVLKCCPATPMNRERENRRHSAALQESAPAEFLQRHLTEIAFPPIVCPQDVLVIGQSMADGIPLGTVELDQLAEACERIWGEMLREARVVYFDNSGRRIRRPVRRRTPPTYNGPDDAKTRYIRQVADENPRFTPDAVYAEIYYGRRRHDIPKKSSHLVL